MFIGMKSHRRVDYFIFQLKTFL